MTRTVWSYTSWKYGKNSSPNRPWSRRRNTLTDVSARRERLAHFHQVLLETEDRLQRILRSSFFPREHRLLDVLAPVRKRINGWKIAVHKSVYQAVHQVGHPKAALAGAHHRCQHAVT